MEREKQFVEALRQIVADSSQAAVARKTGLTQPTICRMLKGERGGTLKTAMRLVEAYPELGRFFAPENIPTPMQ